MSETDPDKSPQQPKGHDPAAPQEPAKKDAPKDTKVPPKAPPPKASAATSSSGGGGGGKALAGVALLVALAGLAAGGYGVWQTQQLAEREQAQREAVQATREQSRSVEDRSQQLASRIARLEQLPSAEQLDEQRRLLAQVQSDQQRLAGRVEQVLGASREQWRLAEAEHLLRMAMLRLSAMQDVNSAASLVEEADVILRQQDDPSAYGARQKLLEGLEALRSLPDVDRTGLFLQLGALRGQASQLSGLAPEFEMADGAAEGGGSTWQRWLNELTRYVRVDFNAGNDVRPLLAGQSLAQVRLALSLAVEQAQWAVLNSNAEVYRQSLEQAAQLIDDHFSDDNAQSRGLRDRLQALAERQVAVTLPDLSPALDALQTYVQKRESAERAGASESNPEEGEDAEQAPAAAESDEGGLNT